VRLARLAAQYAATDGAGFEVRLRKDDELITGHRCETEGIARYVAQDHHRTGWQAVSQGNESNNASTTSWRYARSSPRPGMIAEECR